MAVAGLGLFPPFFYMFLYDI